MSDYKYPPQHLQAPIQADATLASRMNSAKEAVWFRIGVLQSAMNDRERALDAFERVLNVNPTNVGAMTQAGAVLAKKECYPQAVAYLQRATSSDTTCGEAWAVLAHCYVMTDDLKKAYEAYQSALTHLPNPRDPNLWYGIGLLYDRYGSLDNALEAFLAVLNISPEFERADEVCFCIGIIYKEQQNFDEALKYFQKVVTAANPPPPLTRADGWYQIGHVNELKRDFSAAFEMYRAALNENPKHAKTLQNIGWLEHQHNKNSTESIRLLKMSAELDQGDGQTWYLLGRVYMALREFRQAYDAYQQAVYRDGKNATFWCSIGVLYYQMNQFRDALDAYSRAIRLNPYVSEVWYDLGTLYESCGQDPDAIDAYRKAAELAPENTQITERLAVLDRSMTPAAVQQQQQSAQAAAMAASQAGGQAQGMQMGQGQSDMHLADQAHLQSHAMMNRPMAPLGPMTNALQQQQQHKLAHQGPLPPSHQMAAHSGSLDQVAGGPPQHGGQVDIAPIASLRPHGQPQGPSGEMQSRGFPHDARSSLPGPLPSINGTGAGRPSTMMSQPLHAHRQSSVLPPPNAMVSQHEGVHGFHRSAPLPHSQLAPLNNHSPSQDPHRQAQMSHGDQQQHNRLPALVNSQPLPHSQEHGPVPSQPQVQPMQPQVQTASSSHPQSQEQSGQGQPGPLHAQPQGPQPQPQPVHQPPSQPQTTALPHFQTLPQIQSLPMQTHPDPHMRVEGQQHAGPGAADVQRREQENDRGPYGRPGVGPMPQHQYERPEESRLPKISEPDAMKRPSGPEDPSLARTPFSGTTGPPHPLGGSGSQLPALREPGESGPPSAPAPSRSMSMHEITQQGPQQEPQQEPQIRRFDELREQERQQNDRPRPVQATEEVHQNGEKAPVQASEHPAGVSSLSSGPPARKEPSPETREDARLLSSVATPSSAPIPSMGGAESPKLSPPPAHIPASSAPGGAAPGGGAAPDGGAPLPSLTSRPLTISGLSQEGKEPTNSSETHGASVPASSLTKFGKGFTRTPATPVNNSVTPSSLPSPLPARKGPSVPGVVHAARSPRLSKPSNPSVFKSVPVPPPSSTAQIESVPSPSSLPVLPAIASHPSNGEAEKVSSKDKIMEPDMGRDDGERKLDARPRDQATDDRGGRDMLSMRKSDEVVGSKPLYGILRSAPAPRTAETDRSKEDKVKSPNRSTPRNDSENIGTLKRDHASREESGRTAKRPRLHQEGNDSDHNMSYNHDGENKQRSVTHTESERSKDDEGSRKASASCKPDIPSVKDAKTDLRGPNNSQSSDPEKKSKRESPSKAGEEGPKNLGMGSQVIDLPRLSKPVSKLASPPSLPGNTPLPSFRAERKNLTASRGSSGSAVGGKSGNAEGPPRFPIRSAPITPLPSQLKSQVPPSSMGASDAQDSGKADSSSAKRLSEERPSTAEQSGNNSREEGAGSIANGDAQKSSGGLIEQEQRNATEAKAKDDKPASRPEIHSSAT